MKPLLRIADQNFSHGTSLGSGDLKIFPSHFTWYRGKENINDLVIITDNYLRQVDSFKEKTRIAWLLEPPSISPKNYKWVKENYQKFDYVLTYNSELLKTLPNAHIFFYGGCWINPAERQIYKKTKLISIIASDKTKTEGQRLRHEIIRKFKDKIDVYGNGYNPVKNKLEALRDYKYSIVIENEKAENWFTEKINDAFLTGTIPIYWGDTSIGARFDNAGIIKFSDVDEIGRIIGLINGGLFDGLTTSCFIEENFEIAKKYACPEDWLYLNFLNPKGLLP